jgi:hypothetical protein
MGVTALALWVLTALGGLTMAGIWITHSGPAQHRTGASRIAPGRLGSHVGLAAAGLVLWATHVVTDDAASGWIAFALLPVVALLGGLMFMTWLAGRGAAVIGNQPAEQRFPTAVVAAHGLFAVATLAAVLVALLT